MTKKIIFFFVILSFSLGLRGQQIYFSKNYTEISPTTAYGSNVETLSADSGYAFVSLYNCPSIFCSSISFCDKQGAISHTEYYAGKQITGMKYQAGDRSFLLWGHFIDSVSQGFNAFLMRVDHAGAPIWKQSYDIDGLDICRNALELWDKSILIAGSSVYDSSKIVLLKTDSIGNLIWHKSFDFGYRIHDPLGLSIRNDSTILISYRGSDKYVSDSIPVYRDGPGLFEINGNGDIYQDTCFVFSSSPSVDTRPWIVNLPNKRFVTLGSRYNYEGYFGFITNTFVICFDENFKIVWLFPFQYHTQYHISKIAPTTDGGIIGCGTSGFVLNGTFDAFPWVFKISKDGIIEWEKFITPDVALGELVDVMQTPDKGYIATGSFYDGPQISPWLLKLDSIGCLQSNCDSLIVTDVKNPAMLGSKILIYPNPASEKLSFRPPDEFKLHDVSIIVTDITGHILTSIKYFDLKDASLDLSGYHSGLYFVHINDQYNNRIFDSKFVKAK